MKALAIVALTIIGLWLLTVGLGIISVLCGAVVWWLIKTDRADSAQNEFFAICFGLAIIGIVLGLLGH